MPEEEFMLPDMLNIPGKAGETFHHMLGVFVYNFIQLAQTSDPDKLWHLSRALLHGIHSVLLPPAMSGHNGEEPISVKKLKEGEGLWEVRKEIL